jgi:acetaldehyde dehydrogenase
MTVKCAVLGSGNIGTDLMIKMLRRRPQLLECAAMVGIDPESDGLARADRMGVWTTAEGIDGLVASELWADIRVVFDATSAGAHRHHAEVCSKHGKQAIDLTPAAVGPYCVPVVNLEEHLEAGNVNMVTCGGQATIPIVAAIGKVAKVHYGEIVASISSRSAGPGTRNSIDEFTETTSKAIEVVGGATRGKAIIILNPAEPPLIMRDTVFTLTDEADEDAIRAAVEQMVREVQGYVPGYRLKQHVQFERITPDAPIRVPRLGAFERGLKTTVFLEVEGAAHYLPAYAGNLDIMTSAALATGERIAQLKFSAELPHVS